MVWTGWGSNPSRGKIFLFSKMFRLALGSTQPPVQWVPGLSQVQSSQGMMLTTDLHLVQRFRMSGAIPVLPLYT
jgi:hypothetical protein